MPAHLKTISLNRQRADQLAKLAKKQGTTPAKLVEEWIIDAIARDILERVDKQRPLDDAMNELLGLYIPKEKCDLVAERLTPPDWKLSEAEVLDAMKVEVSGGSSEMSFVVSCIQAENIGAAISELSKGNVSGVKTFWISEELTVQIRRAGRSLRFEFDAIEAASISEVSLSVTLAEALGEAMKFKVRAICADR